MRILFLLTAFVFASDVWGLEFAQFPSSPPTPGDFEGQFVIGAANEIEVIKLDCTSFIQGVFFYHRDEEGLVQKGIFSLSNQECVDIYLEIVDSHKNGNGLCMQFDIEKQYYEYSPNDGECDIQLETF